MKFEIMWQEVKQQSTTMKSNKYKLEIEAIGSKQEIEDYAHYCGNWPPSKTSVNMCSCESPDPETFPERRCFCKKCMCEIE